MYFCQKPQNRKVNKNPKINDKWQRKHSKNTENSFPSIQLKLVFRFTEQRYE